MRKFSWYWRTHYFLKHILCVFLISSTSRVSGPSKEHVAYLSHLFTFWLPLSTPYTIKRICFKLEAHWHCRFFQQSVGSIYVLKSILAPQQALKSVGSLLPRGIQWLALTPYSWDSGRCLKWYLYIQIPRQHYRRFKKKKKEGQDATNNCCPAVCAGGNWEEILVLLLTVNTAERGCTALRSFLKSSLSLGLL